MTLLLTILTLIVIGLVAAMMSDEKPKPKKKSLFDSICDIKDISHSPSKRYRR